MKPATKLKETAIEVRNGHTDLATIDDARMELLSRMVDVEDSVGVTLPILKINYVSIDEGAAYPRGTWVCGQTKDQDGNVMEQGRHIISMAILSKRQRYSLFNRKDISQNCCSPLFSFKTPADQVRGNKHGFVCGGACPYRERERDYRCKGQIVVFGVGFTPEGEFVDCMAYLQGASYMPFSDYYRKLTKKGAQDLPPFYRRTMLGSEKAKFDATVYYVATFTQGEMFNQEQLEAFEVRRNSVRTMIDSLNASLVTKPQQAAAEPARPEPIVVNSVEADADVPF